MTITNQISFFLRNPFVISGDDTSSERAYVTMSKLPNRFHQIYFPAEQTHFVKQTARYVYELKTKPDESSSSQLSQLTLEKNGDKSSSVVKLEFVVKDFKFHTELTAN